MEHNPSLSMPTPISFARGDGIGPEIMEATLYVLNQAKARLNYEEIEIGERVYQRGILTGIESNAWESLRRTGIFLKAPITTPQGGGYKSLNVTIRKALGLYVNLRPCKSYSPFIKTKHPIMDVVIIRENEEDTYAGIEHQQSDEVVQCLKLISRPGSERIARYAFEYARQNNRKKICCIVKDNIMKRTDGLFYETFMRIAQDYPEIETERQIVDIGMAHLADTPEQFDVILTENLYGDIISDVGAQIAGSVGLAGSANIGSNAAMFEAIHGSAPVLAGQNKANPSALIQAAVMMLVHIGQADVAENIQNALLVTLEKGFHTADIYNEGQSKKCLTTQDFAKALVDHLGSRPKQLRPAHFNPGQLHLKALTSFPRSQKELVGIDVFIHWDEAGRAPHVLGELLEKINIRGIEFDSLSNRGALVYPQGLPETFCTDHWGARFLAKSRSAQKKEIGFVTHADIIALLEAIQRLGLDFIKTEHLYRINGKLAFSSSRGEGA